MYFTPPHHPILAAPKSAGIQSLESLWDDRSPFSALPRSTSRSSTNYASPSYAHASPARPISQGVNRAGVRTASDIEAEMRAAAQRDREMTYQRQALIEQQRQQEAEYLLRQQEQELLRQQEQEILRREREQEYRQEQELQRQRYLYQQEQAQRQELQQRELRQDLLRQRELQQRDYQQQARTPPPRMLPVSQSPRFLEHQRQVQLLQYQQERQQESRQQQQSLRVQDLQEQLRMESLERQMRAQQIGNLHQRQLSNHTLAELQAAQLEHQRRQRSQSPAGRLPLGEGLHYMPQNMQLQNRLLSEMAQAELLRDFQNSNPAEQEALRMEAMRKILEAEKLEEKRRRRAAKIAHMVNCNALFALQFTHLSLVPL